MSGIFFYIPNDIFNRQVVYDSTFTNMETLFNLTLYDVKILYKKKKKKTHHLHVNLYINRNTL